MRTLGNPELKLIIAPLRACAPGQLYARESVCCRARNRYPTRCFMLGASFSCSADLKYHTQGVQSRRAHEFSGGSAFFSGYCRPAHSVSPSAKADFRAGGRPSRTTTERRTFPYCLSLPTRLACLFISLKERIAKTLRPARKHAEGGGKKRPGPIGLAPGSFLAGVNRGSWALVSEVFCRVGAGRRGARSRNGPPLFVGFHRGGSGRRRSGNVRGGFSGARKKPAWNPQCGHRPSASAAQIAPLRGPGASCS